MRRGTACLAVAAALALPCAAQAAAPRVELRPPDHPRIAVERDARLVMRDGVSLFADVYRPADAAGRPVPGRLPTVLVMTPYNKNVQQGASQDPEGGLRRPDGTPGLFARRGYVVVLVDVRGTGSSQGEWTSFSPEEQADAADIGRWIAARPWSNGRFATYGVSYMAWNGFQAAGNRVPGLRAVFGIGGGEDAYRDVTFHGGAPNTGFMAYWFGYVGLMKSMPPAYGLAHPELGFQLFLDRVSRGAQFPLGSSVSGLSGGEFAYDGEFARARSPGRRAHRIEVPTFVVGGWWDLFVRGQGRLYEQMRLRPGRKQLLMGPWLHAVADGRTPGAGGGFGEGLGRRGAPPRLDALAVAWFDRWLRGVRNGIERFGPVTLNQLGPGDWATHRTWPRPDIRYQRLYLGPGRSGTSRSRNDGRLGEGRPRDPLADRLPANALHGLCTHGTTQWTAGLVAPGTPCAQDQRAQESISLTYTGDRQHRPLHLSGPLALRLLGSTSGRDATWAATLSDVAPGGRSSALSSGWLIHSRRALDQARSRWARNGDLATPFHPFTRESVLDVRPGRTDALDIEIFPTDAVIRPGHRLRLTISSGDVPHLLAPLPTTAQSVGAVSTVHSAPGAPSYLSLPVVRPGARVTVSGVGRRVRRARTRVLVRCPRVERACEVTAVLRAGHRLRAGRRRIALGAVLARSGRPLRVAPGHRRWVTVRMRGATARMLRGRALAVRAEARDSALPGTARRRARVLLR